MCTFGERLKTLRKERNLTQVQLADLVGINVKTVTRYEKSSNPSDDARKNGALNILANFFGVYPEWLLTGNGYKNEWEEIQDKARTDSSVKKAIDFQIWMKKRSELERHISSYFGIDLPPYSLDNENLTHEQWNQAWVENKAWNDLMNSIFNYMEIETKRFKERFEVK